MLCERLPNQIIKSQHVFVGLVVQRISQSGYVDVVVFCVVADGRKEWNRRTAILCFRLFNMRDLGSTEHSFAMASFDARRSTGEKNAFSLVDVCCCLVVVAIGLFLSHSIYLLILSLFRLLLLLLMS